MQIFEDRDAWAEAYRTGWLAHYEQTGETDWKRYVHPRNSAAPGLPGIDLRESRLLLISSAGGFMPESQARYDDDNDLGDYTIRLIPSGTDPAQLDFAHTHYDHSAVEADPQSLVPLGHLAALVDAGRIGGLTPNMISFMGSQPDVTRVLDETIPAIIDAARTELADAALLVPS